MIKISKSFLEITWNEMPFIDCKTELNLKWTKHCVLATSGNDNGNGDVNSDNIVFTIKDTKLYVPVDALSVKDDNQKLSKLLSKGFERSVYSNECKKKTRINIQQIQIDIFSNQTFLS